jgi:hypothetical protein
MELKFEHKAYEKGNKDVQKIERKIKGEKMDKDLYSAIVIPYFALLVLSADLISGVHIFSFGFAL